MKNKRMIAGLGLLIFIAGIGGLCFFLGRQSGKKQTADAGGRVSASNENGRSGENNRPDGNGEEKTAVSFGGLFGSDSAALALCENGIRCSFAVAETGGSGSRRFNDLADQMEPILSETDGIAEAEAFYWREAGDTVWRKTAALEGGSVIGAGKDFFSAADLYITEGRGLTEKDQTDGVRAAVLNERARQQLFDGKEALGGMIEVNGIPYQVVGIAETGAEKAGSGLVVIPESTWAQVYALEEPKAMAVRLDRENAAEERKKDSGQTWVEETAEYACRMMNSMIPEGEPGQYAVQ